MKNYKKVSALLMGAAMILSTVLTGCSGGSDKPADGGATSAAAADGTASDVQKIIDAGVLKVGCKTDVPKFGMQNTSTGEYEGMEVDLAYEIAGKIFGCTAADAKEKKLVAFQGVTAKTRGPLVDNGEVDLIIATYTITPERKETWNFTSPYYTDAVGLMVLKESGLNSIKDLDGKVIGVSQGSTTQKVFGEYTKANGIDVTPTFEEFDGYPALATALAAKNIDVFAVDRAILAGYNDDTTVILDDRFAEQEYGVVSKKENTGLAELAEGVVTELKNNGTLETMLKDWGIE